MDQYDWCDHWREGEEDAGNSGCYIATATLQHTQRPFVLAKLRQWRATYMRTNALGLWLEAKYDQIGPRVVSLIYKNQSMRDWYFNWFVKPAVDLVQKQRTSRISAVHTILIYTIFVLMIITGHIHVWMAKRS
jgi:hypothetical protein